MEAGNQIETLRTPYVAARLNPSRQEFVSAFVEKPARSYLDIGCGEKPRLSVKLGKGDVWVGADPAIAASGETIGVQSGVSVHKDARMFVYSDLAAEVPEFKPDCLISVAPNPKDVVEGNIINDELEKFLDPSKYQFFLLVFDNRTFEAQGYLREALQTTARWMHEHGFQRTIASNAIRDTFRPNSADLGASGNKVLVFARNPKRS
ncbi:hypothetical protein A2V61_02435 [Candidatus Woesebacteria bacterium RBG_19FT_COMBO_47_8]|nr:MAG: hypothetical protein A2V61_02435 [Candidatus Woesebacteria bacterium RBG_19FT_COMBO_47_8]